MTRKGLPVIPEVKIKPLKAHGKDTETNNNGQDAANEGQGAKQRPNLLII